MKKLLLTTLVLGQVVWADVEIPESADSEPVILGADRAPITVENGIYWVQVGETREGFDNLRSAEKAAEAAGIRNKAYERQKVLDQLKNDLGLGELERIALSA